MLKKILSLVLNCKKKEEKKEEKKSEPIPDPWYQKSEYY